MRLPDVHVTQPVSSRLDRLDEFDTIIDVRSPAEFAEDHIPGAINCPVLDNEERIRVGTLYKQVSPFEARKVGAALVSRNIARHIETHFLSKPKGWKPLIYCWRGGQRSGSMTVVLGQIGWQARRLDGGYKAFRQRVLDELEALPEALRAFSDYRMVVYSLVLVLMMIFKPTGLLGQYDFSLSRILEKLMNPKKSAGKKEGASHE